MNFSYKNDSLWMISLSQNDLMNFHAPYLGNGTIGVRVAPTVFSTLQDAHFICLSKEAYDNSTQIVLPDFHALELRIGGAVYSLRSGSHCITQELDLRSGVVSMHDTWTYSKDKTVQIQARMLVSQKFKKLACLDLSISGAPEQSSVCFGIFGDLTFSDPGHFDGINSQILHNHGCTAKNALRADFSAADHVLTGQYLTTTDCVRLRQEIYWDANQPELCTNHIDALSNMNTLTFCGDLNLTLHQYFGPEGMEVQACIDASRSLSFAQLVQENRISWKAIWDKSLACKEFGDPFAKDLLLYQFYLYQSLGGAPLPTGCLGLSFPGWSGAQLWDADLWMFRGVLALNPALVRPMLEYRYQSLENAKKNAAAHGFSGAWYPWQADNYGRAKKIPKEYEHELHNNIWIAMAAASYYAQTRDLEFLKTQGYPIVEAVTDFFCSWVRQDADGKFHLHNVIGPDESLAEVLGTTVSDHFMTCVGICRLTDTACELAQVLGLKPKSSWIQVHDLLYIPQADADGIYPEYTGYNGHTIKQADAILAFYPLDFPGTPAQILQNVKYYHRKTNHGGPLMTCQMEAILEMKYADRRQAMETLLQRFEPYVLGAYRIPYECIGNENSIMLTGIGGLLQALIFGFYGYEFGSSQKLPRIEDFQ